MVGLIESPGRQACMIASDRGDAECSAPGGCSGPRKAQSGLDTPDSAQRVSLEPLAKPGMLPCNWWSLRMVLDPESSQLVSS